MDVTRFVLLLLAMNVFSTARNHAIKQLIYDECGGNGSYPKITYELIDEKNPFSPGLCRNSSQYFAVIRDEFDACVATKVVDDEMSGSTSTVWIVFDKLNTSNLTTDGHFLGFRMNFTLDKSDEVCIALKTTEVGANQTAVGTTWIAINCSTKAKALCVNATKGFVYQNNTNNNIFPEHLFPNSSDDTDKCDFSGWWNESEDIIDFEERWKKYAVVETRDCVAGHGKRSFLAVLQKSSNCSNDAFKFTAFNTTCPNITIDGKCAAAEIPVKPEKVREYMNKPITDYDQNRRTTKLHTKSNMLFSYSVLPGSNASTAGVFHARLFSKETLSANAFDLTFDSDQRESMLSTTHRVLGYRPECVFINKSRRFDTYGCQCTEVDEDRAICVSNHTTVFAVLLSVESVIVPSTVKVLSVVTETISLVFLAVTFFILLRVRKKVRGERIAVQINLVVALFFLHFFALLNDVALHYPALCRAVAVLTYYFLLASALWMTNEAILLFLKTSRWAFLSAKRRKIVIAAMIFAWGTAATLSVLTAAVGFSTESYMRESFLYQQVKGTTNATYTLQYDYCWLSGNSGIRWAAIGPVIFLISVNLAISIKVVVFVLRKRRETKNFRPTEQIKNKHKIDSHYLDYLSASFKAFIVLLPTLGLPWLFLLASNVHQQTTRLTFMYINVIVNGLQGVFVFVVYCIVGREVRTATIKSLSSLSSTLHSITDIPEKRRKTNDVANMERCCTVSKNTVIPHPITSMN